MKNSICVITGDNEELNLKLFVDAIKMPKDEFLVIGKSEAITVFAAQHEIDFIQENKEHPVPGHSLIFSAKQM